MDLRDAHAALATYVKDRDPRPWEKVLDEIRAGRLLVEVGPTTLVIRVAPSPAHARFVERLRALREGSDMTQAELAEEVGISAATMARLMGGVSISSWPVVAAVISTLGGRPADYRADFTAARNEHSGRRPSA